MRYTEFLAHLGQMVTGEGDNPGDASIGTLLAVLRLAEARIYREVKTHENEKSFSGSVSSNAFALPSDFRSASLVYIGSNTKPLEPVSAAVLIEKLSHQHTGECKHFARIGSAFKFSPVVADSTAVSGTYFYAYPDLDSSNDTSNDLFSNNSDLFLFACMVEAAPLYGFMDTLQLWESKFQMLKDQLNDQTTRAAYSAGRIKRRPSTQLMG